MKDLPIDQVLPELRAALAAHPAAVLQAPPGAGKTTVVPLALLDEPWLQARVIVVLEPRRLAARAAAARMAQLRGDELGATIGYRVRFEAKVSPRTRIEVVTEGILTRRLQRDPALAGVGLVIFDEFHERHLQTDLAFALCVDSQRVLRPDLKLLVMSATLDAVAVAALLNDAPVVTAQGRSFPIEIRYSQRDPVGPIAPSVTHALDGALQQHEGDVLVFLPGAREIRQVQEALQAPAEVEVHPLYGDLSWEAQERALRPSAANRRKIVLTTPIAETSLTIEGVRVVVDAGYARVPRFDPKSGLTRLITARISRAAAEQRAGRCGRLGPGTCYRLWSETTQRGLPPQSIPEIRSADLASLALELVAWGARDATQLPWLDPPPLAALAQAHQLLFELGAVDAAGALTDIGRALVEFPLHPRLGRMLLSSVALSLGGLACDIAALLSERDIFITEPRRSCDFSERVEVLWSYRKQQRSSQPGARNSLARIDRLARQYRELLKTAAANEPPAATDVGILLAMAYPDRIGQQRAPNTTRYLLASGRGARLPEQEMNCRAPFIVAASLDAGAEEARIYLAAALDPLDLRKYLAARIRIEEGVRWDHAQQAVLARREERLGELVLHSVHLERAAPDEMRAAMIAGIGHMGLAALPWTQATREWQARVLSVRAWFPQEQWPDVTDTGLGATISTWLSPYLDGMTRREHLGQLDLATIFHAMLDWEQQRRLDELAPTRVRLSNGAQARLSYAVGASPVLAIKLQDMFGVAETPRVGGGRILVTLHLLSPARRPIQITQDLPGFWDRTYAEVRKELKGRYPKHPWPENPRQVPSAKARRADDKKKGGKTWTH